MKQLIRRLRRVSDSSQYCPLRSETQIWFRSSNRGAISRTTASARRTGRMKTVVPEGHVPVYVGDEMERFVVSAELLNHPVFVGLLNESAQEYGYEQKGVLRIPCHVLVFERVVELLRLGAHSRDMYDLMRSCANADEFS